MAAEYERYFTGTSVTVRGAFVDADGDAADPTAVIFQFYLPDGTAVAYTYGDDAEVVKDSVGNYHASLVCDQEGFYYYRVEATDQVEVEDKFYVDAGRLG